MDSNESKPILLAFSCGLPRESQDYFEEEYDFSLPPVPPDWDINQDGAQDTIGPKDVDADRFSEVIHDIWDIFVPEILGDVDGIAVDGGETDTPNVDIHHPDVSDGQDQFTPDLDTYQLDEFSSAEDYFTFDEGMSVDLSLDEGLDEQAGVDIGGDDGGPDLNCAEDIIGGYIVLGSPDLQTDEFLNQLTLLEPLPLLSASVAFFSQDPGDIGIRMCDFTETGGIVGIITPCVDGCAPIFGADSLEIEVAGLIPGENIWTLKQGDISLATFVINTDGVNYNAGLTIDCPLPPEETVCSCLFNTFECMSGGLKSLGILWQAIRLHLVHLNDEASEK